MSLFNIVANVKLKSTEVERGLRTIKGQFSSWGKDIKGQLAGAFTVGAIVAATRNVVEYASRINDLSERFDVNRTKLQEWAYAAKQAGADQESIARAWRALGKARDAALENPEGEQMDAFSMLGIDAASLKNNPLEKTFEDIWRTIQTTDFGADTESLLSKVMGKGAGELIPTFKTDLAAMAEEAHRLGVVLGEDVVKSLDDVGDRLDQIVGQMRGPLANGLLGVLTIAQWVSKTISDMWRVFGAGAMLALQVVRTIRGDSTTAALSNQAKDAYKQLIGVAGKYFSKDSFYADEDGATGKPKTNRAVVAVDRTSSGVLVKLQEQIALKEQLDKLDRSLLSTTQQRAAVEEEINAHLRRATELRRMQGERDEAAAILKTLAKASAANPGEAIFKDRAKELSAKIANLDKAIAGKTAEGEVLKALSLISELKAGQAATDQIGAANAQAGFGTFLTASAGAAKPVDYSRQISEISSNVRSLLDQARTFVGAVRE